MKAGEIYRIVFEGSRWQAMHSHENTHEVVYANEHVALVRLASTTHTDDKGEATHTTHAPQFMLYSLVIPSEFIKGRKLL